MANGSVGGVAARLADGGAVELGELVGADDDGFGFELPYCVGLGKGQVKGWRVRCLAGVRRFADLGGAHVERIDS